MIRGRHSESCNEVRSSSRFTEVLSQGRGSIGAPLPYGRSSVYESLDLPSLRDSKN